MGVTSHNMNQFLIVFIALFSAETLGSKLVCSNNQSRSYAYEIEQAKESGFDFTIYRDTDGEDCSIIEVIFTEIMDERKVSGTIAYLYGGSKYIGGFDLHSYMSYPADKKYSSTFEVCEEIIDKVEFHINYGAGCNVTNYKINITPKSL